jgi:hypothetical protein
MRIFAVVGAVLGLMGFIILTQLGGEAVALSTTVITFALFAGPIIAVPITLRFVQGSSEKDEVTYSISFAVNAGGYLIMMISVVAVLVIGISLISSDGGMSLMGAGGETGSSSGDSGGSLLNPDLIVTVLLLSGLTGLTGVGTARYS